MISKRLIDYAILHKEWYSVASMLDGLAGEYLEGEIESSKDTFNNYFNIVPASCLYILRHISVFESVKSLCVKRIAQIEVIKSF